jgi:flagellar assembly protein FliH
MTTSTERAATERPATERPVALPSFGEPTTIVPGDFGLLPELSTPQERYDNGWKRGYMAGYAEGARAAQAEHAEELTAQKTIWAAKEAKVSTLVTQLASATESYVARMGQRDLAFTEQLLRAAFELAEAVVHCELQTRPDLALAVARSVLADMPAGPATIRVNPSCAGIVERAVVKVAPGARTVTVVPDPAVDDGGCIVTAGAKTADARIEEALQRAKKALLEPTGQQAAEPGAARRGAML